VTAKTVPPPADPRDALDRAAAAIAEQLAARGTIGMGDLLDRLCAAEPACAPLLNLSLELQERSGDGEAAVREALDGALQAVAHQRVATAAAFADLVHQYRWTGVAAAGRSAQLLECLAAGRAAGLTAAVVSEGGPGGEGLRLAGELRGEGFSVLYTGDTALPAFFPDLDAVVVWAEAALGAWFVAPAGTASLLREARLKSCNRVALVPPLARLAPETLLRWRDPGLPRPKSLGRLPKGVPWVGNRYERVPWELANFVLGRA